MAQIIKTYAPYSQAFKSFQLYIYHSFQSFCFKGNNEPPRHLVHEFLPVKDNYLPAIYDVRVPLVKVFFQT